MEPQHPLIRKRIPVAGTPFEEIELFSRSDGGPIRLNSNGGRRRLVGRSYSIKTGYSHPWESRTEFFDMRSAEVRADVLRYVAQLHTLIFRVGAAAHRYTPDRMDFLTGGGIEIVEIKGEFDPATDPSYTLKLKYAASIYAGLGYAFRIIDETEIRREPLFSAIERVFAYRRTLVRASDILVARRCFDASQTIPLEKLEAAFAGERHAFPVICALGVRRILALDLSGGLTPDTPIRLVCDGERSQWSA